MRSTNLHRQGHARVFISGEDGAIATIGQDSHMGC